jgi:hypothetical protein
MRGRRMFLAVVAMASMIGLVSTDAGAVPGLCSTNAQTGGISEGNVTFRGVNASDCYGLISGNSSGTDLSTAFGPGFGINPVLKSDENPQDTFAGIDFTLTADISSSGVWNLAFESDPDTSVVLDMVVAIKAAEGSALWYFPNETFSTDGDGDGTFVITWTNGGGQIPDLSHMEIWFRESDGQVQVVVPAPAGLLLLGSGLLAAAMGSPIARRIRRK